MNKLPYEERLRRYEEEKRLLISKGLNFEEYERALIVLVEKWKI